MAMELNSANAKEWVLRNDVDHWSHARFSGQRFTSSNTQAICSITFRHLCSYNVRRRPPSTTHAPVDTDNLSRFLASIYEQQLAVTRRPFLNMFQHFTSQKCTWLHTKETFNLSQHLTCRIRLNHQMFSSSHQQQEGCQEDRERGEYFQEEK
ncbi:hypothetical protein Taro_053483 [Colocasia esculenta]|uniref:Uncharacterized protein n=1 Tax=Colocasia esculenta TaxID=4460 RepID=A0A843XMQ4_COLES|nr:hypothetical protein [Colocasia esculenta]